ncbi:MAG: hypothetical protein QOK29_295 [Rhodospirillaceae bacterium]|nr:hypothetical protein [Rhodospirillaceae bacterium]
MRTLPHPADSAAAEFQIDPPLQGGRDYRSWLGRAGFMLGLFAVLYVGAMFWLGRASWGSVLGSIVGLRELPLVLGLVAWGVVLRALRFYYFGRRLGWRVPPLASGVVFVASFALTATPGKAGELLKSALLRARYGTPVAQSGGALIVERVGDLVALLILASGGLLLFAGLRSYFLVGVVLVAAICVLLRTLAIPCLERARRFASSRNLAERLLRVLRATDALLRPVPLLVGFGLAVLAWSGEALAFHVLALRLPVAVPLLTSFSIFGLSAVAGALSMLPGGLGGVEAVMVLLLNQLGVAVPEATLTVIIFRFCTIYLTSLLGLCFLGLWRLLPPAGTPSPRSAEA